MQRIITESQKHYEYAIAKNWTCVAFKNILIHYRKFFVLFMKNLWRNKRQCVIIFRKWDRFVLLAWFTDANFCASSLKKHTIIDAESLDLALNRYPLLSHFSFFVVRAANSFPGFNTPFSYLRSVKCRLEMFNSDWLIERLIERLWIIYSKV